MRLAVDVGSVRVGVARSDPDGVLASPLEVIRHSRGDLDRLADLTGSLAERGLSVDAWYGVRVFTDTVAQDAPLPREEELRVLLDCEERGGSTDPYRGVAALVHVIARKAA